MRVLPPAFEPTCYATAPDEPPTLSDCTFYHTMELPGLGTQYGQWDLRPGIADYLGATEFAGCRVLEIGTADGFVCFELERRGASVVAFDLADDLTYDALPLSGEFLQTDAYRNGLRRIRNAYWLGHRLFRSSARVAYGHVNRLPAFLGQFDIGLIANVLQHLQDPIGAIAQVARVCNRIVVTETDWLHGQYDDVKGLIYFDKDNPYVWFQVKPILIEAVLRRLGFGNFCISHHTQRFVEDAEHRGDGSPIGRRTDVDIPHFTVTAERIVPIGLPGTTATQEVG
ncbi:hypothetical protein STAQ_36720 [Allostella sp. ATCC 35155]|nr:hypothetical protein STAQ_36720 [Stella sp. ATCC 35155]